MEVIGYEPSCVFQEHVTLSHQKLFITIIFNTLCFCLAVFLKYLEDNDINFHPRPPVKNSRKALLLSVRSYRSTSLPPVLRDREQSVEKEEGTEPWFAASRSPWSLGVVRTEEGKESHLRSLR